MVTQLDLDNPEPYLDRARSILSRYATGRKEANTSSAVRDFLITTGLIGHDDTEQEENPSANSSQAVDLIVPSKSVYIEFKYRIGTSGKGDIPSIDNLRQIDNYVSQAERTVIGGLTDGKHWILRTARDSPNVVREAPYRFTLHEAEDWLLLYEWLRDYVFSRPSIRPSTTESVAAGFAPTAPAFDAHTAAISALFSANAHNPTVRIKRQLWEVLLGAALGEVPATNLDDLFVRHTYLVTVLGMITQATIGIDILERAANDPKDLIHGTEFANKTGLINVVESDFFSWLTEVPDSIDLLHAIAQHVAAYDWQTNTSARLASMLYQTVIPAEERRQLGEYYTPPWLASEIVRTAVPNPLDQRILDPACGSGAFLVEAIEHLIEAANDAGLDATETLGRLQRQVLGIDVHPVAVHLARTAWVLAAREAILAGATGDVAVPVYLGDSLQLLYDRESILNADEMVISIAEDEQNRQLRLPRALVARPEVFGSLMSAVANAIHAGDDPVSALAAFDMDEIELTSMTKAVALLDDLHKENRNHIWAYYTRNLLRPIAIATEKVDVIVGNPPWIAYNKTVDTLRAKMRSLGNEHNIWIGGKYATTQDISGLFFLRCMDLYLSTGGICSMVLPHGALIGGQYGKWRTGIWNSESTRHTLQADLAWDEPWDLEPLDPNNFFPVPACVVHAQRADTARRLPRHAQRFEGSPDRYSRRRARLPSAEGASPYSALARQGATVAPRRLYLLNELEADTIISASGTRNTSPRKSTQDKKPWKDLSLTDFEAKQLEEQHLFRVHLGESLVPYATLEPRLAVLPLHVDKNRSAPQLRTRIDTSRNEPEVILNSLGRRTQKRWKRMSELWEENKGAKQTLSLVARLNYGSSLAKQLEWQETRARRAVRVIHNASGRATAAIVNESTAYIDTSLYWIPCDNLDEAHYLLAVINSDHMWRRVQPLMSKGQFGPRHLHKKIWQFPIPRFETSSHIHRSVADAGKTTVDSAGKLLKELSVFHGNDADYTTYRKELRSWLASSREGQAVERAVKKLLEQ